MATANTTIKKTLEKKDSTPSTSIRVNKKSDSFAVIETGGKQYRVVDGEVLTIEKLPKFKEGGKVTFDKVLVIDDGKTTKIGSPYIKGAKVEAEFIEEGRGKKIMVIRFKSKSRHFKKKGHRQPYNLVKITKL